MNRVAFVFPGQGAQSVGMGKDLVAQSPVARGIFETFNQVVPHLSRICFEGPEEELKRTLYTQPAILATSLACLALFQEKIQVTPVVTAGHSLGEYGALVASGVLTIETAARLIQKRAELMDQAQTGAMSAVLGLATETVESVVQQAQTTGVVTVANYNTANQVVISGSPEAVASAGDQLKAAGAKRVLPLPVGGAFHSPLMDEAAHAFGVFLAGFSFNHATVPVMTNVDAQLTTEAEVFRTKLGTQINHSVRWAQSMARMVQELGVDTVVEFGPGKVLTGMFKTVSPNLRLYNISDWSTLEAVLAEWHTAVPA